MNYDTLTAESPFAEKKEQLHEILQKLTEKDLMVAFSGGVDSAVLLELACKMAEKQGTTVYAVTVNTRLHPAGDVEIAANLAKKAGAVHKVLTVDELNEAGIENKQTNTCYRCKKTIFSKILAFGKEIGVDTLIEGTNEDDLHVYRPGIRALHELGIISPLALCKLTKTEVRVLASELGLTVANRPSTPCLATRLPYDTPINYELLRRIEGAEEYIRDLGFYNVRLRVHGSIARLEVDKGAFPQVLVFSDIITARLKELGFAYITLDLQGFRSGSMDEPILTAKKAADEH